MKPSIAIMLRNSSSQNICPVCHTLCKETDEIRTFVERSIIGCDGWNVWFHNSCIKITPKKLGESNWYYTICEDK